MRKYVIRRFIQLIPILLGITLLSFILTNIGTTDVIDTMESNQGVVMSEEEKDQLQANVSIDRIDYGLTRVKVPNTDESYYYVPGIVFWGSSEIVHQDTDEVWDATEERVILVLNAIDGSVINVEQG